MVFVHETPLQKWGYIQDGSFTVNFSFLEAAFNAQALKEKFITEKEHAELREIIIDPENRTITLETKIFKLQEN